MSDGQPRSSRRDTDADVAERQQAMVVLLFAGLADVSGRPRLELGPPWPVTVAELRERLGTEVGALGGATFRVAINQRYATDGDPVRPGDEIALIPPVSGG